jgi:hypothetical protein
MSAMTRAQANRLLELVNRATGRQHRTLSQAARNFGMSGGAVTRITDTQAAALIDEWSTKPEHVGPWAGAPVPGQEAVPAGESGMTPEEAASILGHEVLVTTAPAQDGIAFIPDAVELLEDGRPALRGRVALAEIASWRVA